MAIEIAAGVIIAAFLIGLWISGMRLTSSPDATNRGWGYLLHFTSMALSLLLVASVFVG